MELLPNAGAKIVIIESLFFLSINSNWFYYDNSVMIRDNC